MDSTASLSIPRGATTAVRAGLGPDLAKSSRPRASTPERVARASRSWRRNTFVRPSVSIIFSTSRSPTKMETAGVKRHSFRATNFRSVAMSK